MYYINDRITSIKTKRISQLLQKMEANKLWSWGEAEKSGKFKVQEKNKIVVQIYWTHVRPVHPPTGAPVQMLRHPWIICFIGDHEVVPSCLAIETPGYPFILDLI